MQYRSRSFVTHVGSVAAVLVGVLLLHVAFDAVIAGVNSGGTVPAWLSLFGTMGTTVTLYSQLLGIVTYLVAPALIFVIGYQYGRVQSTSASET